MPQRPIPERPHQRPQALAAQDDHMLAAPLAALLPALINGLYPQAAAAHPPLLHLLADLLDLGNKFG